MSNAWVSVVMLDSDRVAVAVILQVSGFSRWVSTGV